jgi:hypothetical protein
MLSYLTTATLATMMWELLAGGPTSMLSTVANILTGENHCALLCLQLAMFLMKIQYFEQNTNQTSSIGFAAQNN